MNEERIHSLMAEIQDFKEAEEDSPAVSFYKELKKEYDDALEKVYQAIDNLRKPSPPSIFQWLKIVLRGEDDARKGGNGIPPDLLETAGLEDARKIIEDAPVAVSKFVGEKYPDASLNLISHIRSLLRLDEEAGDHSGEVAACYAATKNSLEELKELNIKKRRVYSIGVRYTLRSLRSLPDASNTRALIMGARKWSWLFGTSAGFFIGWFAGRRIDPKQAELVGSIAGGFVGLIIAAVLIWLNERKASRPVYRYFENVKHLRPALETSFQKMFYIVAEHVGVVLEEKDRIEIEKMHKNALKGALVEPLLVHFLKIKSARYGQDSIELVETLRKLNDICQEQFRFEEAEPYLKHILEIYDKQRVQDPRLTVDVLYRLAKVYYRMKDYSKVEPLLQRAHSIRVEPENSGLRARVNSLHRLATLYKITKQHAKEKEKLEEALKICEEEAPEHLFSAGTMIKLGRYYRKRGDFEEAERFFLRALGILETQYPDGLETVRMLHRLAKFYSKNCRFDDAKPLLERALAICQKEMRSGAYVHERVKSLKFLAKLEKKRRQGGM